MGAWLKPAEDITVPPVWYVCFTGNMKIHWWDRFLADGFRHVFMLGYLPGRDSWMLYDCGILGTTIAVLSGSVAGAFLTLALNEGGVLSIAPLSGTPKPRAWWQHVGWWCVPSVLHVLGYRCVAITPKGLHDKLLKLGARPFPEPSHGNAGTRCTA